MSIWSRHRKLLYFKIETHLKELEYDNMQNYKNYTKGYPMVFHSQKEHSFSELSGCLLLEKEWI